MHYTTPIPNMQTGISSKRLQPLCGPNRWRIANFGPPLSRRVAVRAAANVKQVRAGEGCLADGRLQERGPNVNDIGRRIDVQV